MQDKEVIQATQAWIKEFVVGLNLCPFAKQEVDRCTLRYVTTSADTEVGVLAVLTDELETLSADASIETTLLIHPQALSGFYEFNHFLGACDHLLKKMDLSGTFQIASFHPNYQFVDTEPEDAENFSNRSPYPMLHILRESSVEQAVASYPAIHELPARNLETLNQLGTQRLNSMRNTCYDRRS